MSSPDDIFQAQRYYEEKAKVWREKEDAAQRAESAAINARHDAELAKILATGARTSYVESLAVGRSLTTTQRFEERSNPGPLAEGFAAENTKTD